MSGFTEFNEVLFKYSNLQQNLTQNFGFSLNYYKPHVEIKYHKLNGEDVEEKNLSTVQKLLKSYSEGAYLFKPEWEDFRNNGTRGFLYDYSTLDSNVVF